MYTLYTHCVKFLVNIETRSVEKRRKKGKIRGRVDTIYLYRRASSYLHEICSRSSSSIYSLLSSITDERILAKKIASIIESMFEFDDILTDYNRFVIRFARILFDYHGIAMIIVHDNGPIKIKGHGKSSKIVQKSNEGEGERKRREGEEKKKERSFGNLQGRDQSRDPFPGHGIKRANAAISYRHGRGMLSGRSLIKPITS